MALKRKELDLEEQPCKKFRRGITGDDEAAEVDTAFFDDATSDNSLLPDLEDTVVEFTEHGQKRADSEARRRWDYICTYEGCMQRFNRPCRLEAHMRRHNKERPFSCTFDDCDKTFPRKDHLQRHLKNAHTQVERAYICDWEGCDKRFTTDSLLQRHREVHESKFYCTGYAPCKEVFRKHKTLEAHVRTKHLRSMPYPCTYVDEKTGERCTSGYQTEQALRRHGLRKHSDEEEPMFFCMLCPAPGSGIESVATETGIVNVPKDPLPFAKYEELVAHTREAHPPVCSECDITFSSQEALKNHCQILHGDPEKRPKFPCLHLGCDRIFTRAGNLNAHVRTVHEQQKRFFCDASFFTNSKHEDLKRWDGLNACGGAYSAKSSLEQHVRTHHLGLANRKLARKDARKKPSQAKAEPSALRLLTGVGYDGGRDVPCLVKDCGYRFFMDRDLRRHLRAIHKLEDEEIREKIRERDALQGGPFWIGGLDEPMFESTEPSIPQTPDFHQVPNMCQGPLISANNDSLKVLDHLLDPQLASLDDLFDPLDLSLLGTEEAEMDREMGIDTLPAFDVRNGL